MKKKFLESLVLALSLFLVGNISLQAQNSDSTETKMIIYGNNAQVLGTYNTSEIDSIIFVDNTPVKPSAPVADMLDVVFHEDGTAEDVSAMKNEVTLVGNSSYTRYSKAYGRYIAVFNNVWSRDVSGYYRVSFENNQEFRNKLADGHSLEIVVMPNYSGTLPNRECKPFSAMQAGGTGFLVTTSNSSRDNEFCFLPNTSTNGKSTWRWATSGIIPQPKEYYHLVGVWNKEEGKAYIYVNGELKNTISAPGNFNFASSGSNWFCIGGDSDGNSAASNGWNGNIVLARIYDNPLTQTDVTALWNKVNVDASDEDVELVKNLSYLNGLAVKAGGSYTLKGEGFAEGDELKFTSVADKTKTSTISLSVKDNEATFNLPSDVVTGQYRMTLLRGEKTQELGAVSLSVVEQIPAGMKVIAHRGYWDVPGAATAHNSRASLQNAINLGCYGSETDVWITTDGHLMIYHDASLSGTRIENSTYDQVKNLTISNGEKIPQLSDFLNIIKGQNTTKLIIELKTHTDEARGLAAAKAIVDTVKSYGVQDKVEYIAFSLNLCKELAKQDPTAHVSYLNGDKSPAELKELGIMGLDYTAAKFRSNPTWAAEARANGMTTNVWTINDTATMTEMTNAGIDFVTTDAPVDAQYIEKVYNDQRGE